ncbi:MAG: hypothetical protein ACWA5P_04905 [bacterium]
MKRAVSFERADIIEQTNTEVLEYYMGELHSFFLEEPNWLILMLISGLFGILIKPLLQLLIYIYRKFNKTDIEHKWYGYFIILKNKEEFIGKENLYIKQGIFNKYIVHGISITTEGQEYKGTVKEERNFLIIQMNPTKHDEEIFIRLKRTIPGNDEVMYGLWSALDFDGNAAVGPMILSKKELNDDKIRELTEFVNIKKEIKGLSVS